MVECSEASPTAFCISSQSGFEYQPGYVIKLSVVIRFLNQDRFLPK